MYLFEDQKEKEISVMCKLCLREIKFKITVDEFQETKTFPIKKEDTHGTPPHKLIIMIEKNLEVSGFEIEGVGDKKELSYSRELTKQVLSEIDLNEDEIELYFRTTGRDAVSLGEMSILIEKPKEECEIIAKKFVEKGIFKEIVGATPHYTALPPYAALVSQLEKFHEFVTSIKEEAPKQLDDSFKQLESKAEGVKQLTDYTDFIMDLKNNALQQMYAQKKEFDNTISDIDKITEVTGVIAHLEDDTKVILVNQIKDLKTQFEDIVKQIYQIMRNHIQELTEQFIDIQKKISGNLKKLRLGVIQQTVDQVIEKVFSAKLKQIKATLNNHLKTIQQAFADGLKKTVIGFNTQFVAKLKSSIDHIVEKINSITDSSAKSGETIKNVFANVSKDFSKAVILAEEKLGGISESVFGSFGNLRKIFTSRVIDALNIELGKILERLEISEIATREFWEQAKQVSLYTMQAIFFVRSVEAAKAHVNDEIAKAKMRILIVAPEITNIDVEKLKARPTHINIRIAANINVSIPEHLAMIKKLDEMHNVSYRSRDLRNLWGINRDYEEVILCVVSEMEIDGKVSTEIAGLGSIIEEHIKIFVPVLEDAWVGAHKDIDRTMRPVLPRKVVTKRAPAPKKAPAKKAAPLPKPKPKAPAKTAALPTPKIAPPKKPSVVDMLQKPAKQPSKKAAAPAKKVPAKKAAPIIPDATSLTGDANLSNQFDNILNNIDKLRGSDIGAALAKFQDDYSKTHGYSGVLKQVGLSANQLSGNPNILTSKQIGELKKKLNFWRKKMKL
jgi:hypothetical protein